MKNLTAAKNGVQSVFVLNQARKGGGGSYFVSSHGSNETRRCMNARHGARRCSGARDDTRTIGESPIATEREGEGA